MSLKYYGPGSLQIAVGTTSPIELVHCRKCKRPVDNIKTERVFSNRPKDAGLRITVSCHGATDEVFVSDAELEAAPGSLRGTEAFAENLLPPPARLRRRPPSLTPRRRRVRW